MIQSQSKRRIALLAASAILLIAALALRRPLLKAMQDPAAIGIQATAETTPVPTHGDAADDPAIFVNADDPSRSLILGTDKNDGLAVYDLSGQVLQYIGTGHFNNVDIRRGFPIGEGSAVLVAACETAEECVALFVLDPVSQRLREIGSRFPVGVDPAGLCLSVARDGQFHVFVCGFDKLNNDEDWLEQWQINTAADDGVTAAMVRRIRFDSACEGMAADDAAGLLYVSEEHVGIWVFDAATSGGTQGRLVQRTVPDGPLVHDVEGLALVDGADGGYIVASSQGSDDFIVFRRNDPHTYLGRFEVVSGRGIDAVSHSDGIDCTAMGLGEAFPGGLFVTQDDRNRFANQNFKLVSWAEIRANMRLP